MNARNRKRRTSETPPAERQGVFKARLVSSMVNQSVTRQEEATRSIGEKLKRAREARSLTIEQAHIKTRIHRSVLESLEEGRLSKSLSSTYIKAFLKEYATFLGLDGQAVAKEYQDIFPRSAEAEAPPVIHAPKELHPQPVPKPAIAAALVVVAALVFGIAKLLSGPNVSEPVPSRNQVKKQSAPVVQPRRSSAPARKLPLKVVEATAVEPPRRKEPIARDERVTQLDISEGEPLVLTLKVKRPVYVRVTRDGEILFENLLKEGSVETVRANKRLNLRIANIDALKLILNKKELVFKKKGEIRDLEITRSGIRLK